MQAPKATPRFLPTLTEVVKPSATVYEESMQPSAAAPTPSPLTEDALVAAVMERLLPNLEHQVQNALRQSLQAQFELLLPAVMADLEDAVRSAVRESAAHPRDAKRS